MFSRYYGIFITRFREQFAYRFSYFMRVISNFIALFIIWFIWRAIFDSSTGVISGFTFNDMMTYMALSIMFTSISQSYQEHEIEFDVMSGSIATHLIKPISYPITCFYRDLSENISTVLFRVLPIAIVAFLFLNISGPVSLLFIPSLIISYLITYNFVFLTGMWVIWSRGHIWGVRTVRSVVAGIFSGSLIPIALFPQWLANIAYALPFIATIHVPISLYLGKMTGTEIVSALGLQLFWVTVMTGLSVLVWLRAKKKIFIQGG